MSRRQAGKIFRRRWRIEVQIRSLKQTFGRTRLRSRTPDRALIELQWSLVGLWMVQLLARQEQIKSPGTERCTSVAAALRIVRQVMRYGSDVPRRTERFTARLSCAVIDAYSNCLLEFSTEQSIFEVGGVCVGGRPGANPTLLFGSPFYHGHKVNVDEDRFSSSDYEDE